jgi:hypothetical protein
MAFLPGLEVSRMEQQHLLKQRERADSTVPSQASLGGTADPLFQVVRLAPTCGRCICIHDGSPPKRSRIDRGVRMTLYRGGITVSEVARVSPPPAIGPRRAQTEKPIRSANLLTGVRIQWVRENLPESFRIRTAAGGVSEREPRASDGIDRMVVPAGCEDLLQEIRDGAQVGDALAMLLTADNSLQSQGDEAVLRDRLATYWANHGTAERAPSVIECWSGFPTERKRGQG